MAVVSTNVTVIMCYEKDRVLVKYTVLSASVWLVNSVILILSALSEVQGCYREEIRASG